MRMKLTDFKVYYSTNTSIAHFVWKWHWKIRTKQECLPHSWDLFNAHHLSKEVMMRTKRPGWGERGASATLSPPESFCIQVLNNVTPLALTNSGGPSHWTVLTNHNCDQQCLNPLLYRSCLVACLIVSCRYMKLVHSLNKIMFQPPLSAPSSRRTTKTNQVAYIECDRRS